MQTIHELYLQNPLWVWLAVGATFLATDMALGLGLLIWPGLAASLVGLLNLAGFHLGLPAELAVFSSLSVLGLRVAQAGKAQNGLSPKAATKTSAGLAFLKVGAGKTVSGASAKTASRSDAQIKENALVGLGDWADDPGRTDLPPIPLPVRRAGGSATRSAERGGSGSRPETATAQISRKPLTFRPPEPVVAPRRSPQEPIETRAPAMAMQLAGQSAGTGREGPRRVVVASSSAARLIGRIGRAAAPFVNGAGVIWIDGGAWRADMDEGQASVTKDAPVRILGVGPDGRLQVRGLSV